MSSIASNEYDRGVHTFDPDGRRLQIEYSLEAVRGGNTVVGILTKEGVLVVAKKTLASPLVVSDSIEKIVKIDTNMGAALTGLTVDGLGLIEHARSEAVNHWFTYDEQMPTKACVKKIAEKMLDFSDQGLRKRSTKMSRPYGVSVLVIGVDKEGAHLLNVEPTGNVTKFKACALGFGCESATLALESHYRGDLTMDEGLILAMTILRHCVKDNICGKSTAVALVETKNATYKALSKDEIQSIIDRLPEKQGDAMLAAAAAGAVSTRADLSYD